MWLKMRDRAVKDRRRENFYWLMAFLALVCWLGLFDSIMPCCSSRLFVNIEQDEDTFLRRNIFLAKNLQFIKIYFRTLFLNCPASIPRIRLLDSAVHEWIYFFIPLFLHRFRFQLNPFWLIAREASLLCQCVSAFNYYHLLCSLSRELNAVCEFEQIFPTNVEIKKIKLQIFDRVFPILRLIFNCLRFF